MTAMEFTVKLLFIIFLVGWLMVPFTLVGIRSDIQELIKTMNELNKEAKHGERFSIW